MARGPPVSFGPMARRSDSEKEAGHIPRMVNISISYDGELHCTATHEPSKRELATDAPVDNNGKGESFSPTDLMATALGTCMSTILAMTAEKNGLDVKGMSVKVSKEMSKDAPRRIVGVACRSTDSVAREYAATRPPGRGGAQLPRAQKSAGRDRAADEVLLGRLTSSYCPSTQAKINGAQIVASLSTTNFGVEAASLPQVIFSFGTAPE